MTLTGSAADANYQSRSVCIAWAGTSSRSAARECETLSDRQGFAVRGSFLWCLKQPLILFNISTGYHIAENYFIPFNDLKKSFLARAEVGGIGDKKFAIPGSLIKRRLT